MKYAVIGTSWITEEFIMGAQTVEGLELFGVCSRSYSKGKAFSEKFGAPRVFIDLHDLARCGDVEAVYVASPNSLHYEQCRTLLAAGKHVICEKPITANVEQLKELQALAAEDNKIYMEAIMYMHSPVRPKLKASLQALGNITSAHFDFSQLSSKYPAYKRGENPNIFNPEFATGCLMDLGIYCVYPALDLFGLPKKITACAHFMESGADGSGNAAFLYSDKLVNLTYSKLGQDRLGSQIFGDEGTITIESISKLTNMKLIDNSGNATEIIGDVPKEKLMGYEAKAFEEIIANPDNPYYAVTAERALQVSKAMKEIRDLSGIKFDI